ncbi:MAG: YitT family protein [Calditrichaeota bacterium]|nr:MAG: YitT family protein [Calditrichota bacterium]MBL1204328.1 YitT family protein [Calditrichota bacterium]NOG44157.1 YitT family protein [Calditrichota bacterium]
MKKQILKDYFFIMFGATLMGLSISVFMIDARVVPGGVSGIAMALHFINENIPTGLALWLMNIPLFVWGIKELGWGFARRTIFGFSISAFSIDLFHGDFPGLEFFALNKSEAIVDLLQNDFLFLIIIGAVLLGVGMGFVLKHQGTTGGADVVAAILQRRFGYKPGNSIMVMNFFIITFATAVIYINNLSPNRPAISLAFYALMLTFIISRIVDVMIDGFDYARSALIISEKGEEIADAIMNRMSRGATALKGRGLYRNTDREILMTVITRREIIMLESLIKEIDPDAFVIISTVHEVLGEGFKRRA